MNKFQQRIITQKSKCNFKRNKYYKYFYEVIEEEFYVYHIIIECQIFESERRKYLSELEKLNEIRKICLDLPNDPDKNSVKKISLFEIIIEKNVCAV